MTFTPTLVHLGGDPVDQVTVDVEHSKDRFFIESHTWFDSL